MKSRTRSYINSSSFVMALVFTLLCGLASLSLGYFINYFAKGHFVHGTEAVLDTKIRYFEAVGIEGVEKENALYIFLDEDGGLPDIPPEKLSRLAEGIIVFDYPTDDQKYAAKIHTLLDGKQILIGTDITEISKDYGFMQWLGVASICFVMMVVFVAFIISVFVVSGTNKIADTARDIMDTGDLSRRVDVGSRWDDLSNTAAVLNMLLDRIEELMRGVRRVSDNIAHDLRTPLTRMRGKIEALSDSDQKQALLDEADGLLSTFNALLRISRIESEKQRSQFSDVDLKALLQDVVEFYEPLADEKSLQLSADLSEAQINGDRDLLFQAYANLLDNAIKFTPVEGQVKIRLMHDGGKINISISDTGIGIPEDEKDKIFNRFFRSEASRSSTGTGLGLSLVRAVITLHNGKIEVENAHPGLRIVTIL